MHDDESIDISNMPDVIKLVHTASNTGRLVELRQGDSVVATLRSTIRPDKESDDRQMTKIQIDALRSAAGGWADFDSDAFIDHVYAERERDDRPDFSV